MATRESGKTVEKRLRKLEETHARLGELAKRIDVQVTAVAKLLADARRASTGAGGAATTSARAPRRVSAVSQPKRAAKRVSATSPPERSAKRDPATSPTKRAASTAAKPGARPGTRAASAAASRRAPVARRRAAGQPSRAEQTAALTLLATPSPQLAPAPAI